MSKKIRNIIGTAALLLSSCSSMSEGSGQVMFHWERENTGIYKFSRDHQECMKQAEDFRFMPDIGSWFYSEEMQLNLRAKFHAEKGIWASYVAYPGAQPVMVRSIKSDSGDTSPRKYRICMESRGYWHRTSNIPTHSNLFMYNPQEIYQGIPFKFNKYD